LNTINIIYSII